MTSDDQNNLDIDPSMIVLGLGYVTCLFVAIGWMASFVT